MTTQELKENAFYVRHLYRTGEITKNEAKNMLKEYEAYFNEKSAELAKKYCQRTKKFDFASFMR